MAHLSNIGAQVDYHKALARGSVGTAQSRAAAQVAKVICDLISAS
jgi:hypothetical protein